MLPDVQGDGSLRVDVKTAGGQQLAGYTRLLTRTVVFAVQGPVVTLEFVGPFAENLAGLHVVILDRVEPIALHRTYLHADRATMRLRDHGKAAFGLDLRLQHAAVILPALRDRAGRATPNAQ